MKTIFEEQNDTKYEVIFGNKGFEMFDKHLVFI